RRSVAETARSVTPPLIGYLQENLSRMKLCDEIGRIRVSVALQEALINAIHHGNLEVTSELREKDDKAYLKLVEERRRHKDYRNRRVYVSAKESPAEAVYTLRDHRPRLHPSPLPHPPAPPHPP